MPAPDVHTRILAPLDATGIPYVTDIAAMLRISGSLIDRAALSEWIERLDLREQWRRAEAFSLREP